MRVTETPRSFFRRQRIAIGALMVVLSAMAAPSAHAETEREYCERQQGSAKIVCLRALDQASAPSSAAARPASAVPAASTADAARAYCERQQGSARIVCLRDLDNAKAMPAPSAARPASTTSATSAGGAARAYCEQQQGSARIVCLRDLDKAQAQPAPAAAAGTSAASAAPVAMPAAKPGDAPAGYKVVDGFRVDPQTLIGFQTWRAAACDRCHGAEQQGLVGPSLINSLKTLSKADFTKTVADGRLEKGMPSFKTDKRVVEHMDQLYMYLKGRSDGTITQAHVKPIE